MKIEESLAVQEMTGSRPEGERERGVRKREGRKARGLQLLQIFRKATVQRPLSV